MTHETDLSSLTASLLRPFFRPSVALNDMIWDFLDMGLIIRPTALLQSINR